VTQNLPDNTSTMSVRPAFNWALSDLGPRVDISHKIRGNMLREQDWSTNAGQAFQLMRAAPHLPVVEMVGDIAIHGPRNQEPGSGYLGYYHKKARDLPTNNQLPENPATAVDLVRENIQTVSDSIEQALANDGIRHKPLGTCLLQTLKVQTTLGLSGHLLKERNNIFSPQQKYSLTRDGFPRKELPRRARSGVTTASGDVLVVVSS